MEIQVKEQLSQWQKNKKTLPLSHRLRGRLSLLSDSKKAFDRLAQIQLAAQPEEAALPQESRPVEEDFYEVTYRALSATMLADRPIDFSKAPMLKRSAKMLVGQTVYLDHETSVKNWVGTVSEVFWDEETKGFPPGINARLKLDMIKDPMTVRGVLQGAIHSASVTVSFEWEPSHPDLMDAGSFFENLGQEIDGEKVRIVVTKIDRYWEISLVWQGADQFAKQIDEEGDPVNPPLRALDPFTHAEGPTVQNLSGSNTQVFSPPCNLGKESEMTLSQKALEALMKLLGVESLKDVDVEAKIAELTAQSGDKDKVISETAAAAEKLSAQIAELKAENATLKEKAEILTAQAKIGETYLQDEREEAARLYKLAKDRTSDVILKTLNEASLELVQAWKKEFKEEVEAKFPSQCGKCGSKEISKRSSKEEFKEIEADTIATPILSKVEGDRLNKLHA